MHLIYLHGFASSPGSHKASLICEALARRGVPFTCPDLNEGDFFGLTISRQVALVRRTADAHPDGPLLLMGSSMGAYVAALFAASSRRVQAMVLMAPAFDFIQRWTDRLGEKAVARWERTGSLEVMHFAYDQQLPIGWDLVADARTLDPTPEISVPTLIFHGRRDEVVPCACSEAYARGRPNVELVVLDADHGLGEVTDTIIARSLQFLSPWLP